MNHVVYALVSRDNGGERDEELIEVTLSFPAAMDALQSIVNLSCLEEWGMEYGELTLYYPKADDIFIIQRKDLET